jgi:hypothetical protein
MSVSGIHAQDAGDCTTAQLLQAQGALGDAQDALEDDDVSGALELIAEANDLLTECSGEQTSSGGGGSRGGSTGAPDIEIAQGDTKDFESEDGSYTFVYPDTWFLVVDLGDRTVAANTADASVEVMQENPNPGRGEFWVFITPFELGEVDDLTSFTEDLVSEVFPDEEITDVVEVEFQGPGGRRDVRRVAYTDLVGLDQRIILAEMNDGWWGVMFVRARENEIEDYMPEILVVASTLTRE